MTLKNRIYPIFLPHAGCPFQCVYCDQNAVTCSRPPSTILSSFQEQLSGLLGESQNHPNPGEIAFYGGTFTALPWTMLQEILETVSREIQQGRFNGIRFSTRPDGITPQICSLLKKYPVRTIELGVQSFSDEVLTQSLRGYDAETAYHAVSLIKKENWDLGLQFMVGLPGDTHQRFMETVSKAVALQPDFVRLYPTLVLEGTLLSEWYRQNLYRPLELEDTIDWCARAYDMFFRANIPVARLGLHADPQLEKPGVIAAGPYHPALGYLVRVRWWRNRIDEKMNQLSQVPKDLILCVPERSKSEVIGPWKSNLKHWQDRYHLTRVQIKGKPSWIPGQFEWYEGENEKKE